jgi:hypothetical protein
MNKLSPCLLGLSLAVACGLVAAAQENSPATPSFPKVLQVTREFTKPYKGGAAHDKTETAFVEAFTKAKWPTHYIGMTSLSGKSRALYLTPYASFEAWEKDGAAVAKNAVLLHELERAALADGELLDEVDQGVFVYSEESSLHPMADLSHQRFMEVSVYQVRPGHTREWREAVKMVKGAYEKAGTGAHWAMFHEAYGGQGGRYLILQSHKTLAEIDSDFLNDKKFAEVLGEEGLKHLDELIAASVESAQHELFRFNPHMSYVADEWIAADPDFWKPKPASE